MTPAPKPEVGVGAVVVAEGRLLMIRRGRQPASGRWSLPGGRLEAGETLAQAVEREVAEETGQDVACGAFVGYAERMGEGWHFVILDFEATVTTPRTLLAGDDAEDAAWVGLDQVAELDLVDGLLDFLVEHGVLTAKQ